MLELAIFAAVAGTFVHNLFFAPSGTAAPPTAGKVSGTQLDPDFTGPLNADGSPVSTSKEFHAYLSTHGCSPMKSKARPSD